MTNPPFRVFDKRSKKPGVSDHNRSASKHYPGKKPGARLFAGADLPVTIVTRLGPSAVRHVKLHLLAVRQVDAGVEALDDRLVARAEGEAALIP